jgi:AraC-like DNA-binding protein/quercetin dioxygenase-like cupin family protein
MSPVRQAAAGARETVPPATVGAIPLPRGGGFGRHHHPAHQLAWASSGVLTLGTDVGTWLLPSSRALWIPAGIEHTVEVSVEATMCSLYFTPAGCPVEWPAPTVLAVDGLLGELLGYLADPELAGAQREPAERVLLDLVPAAAETMLATRLPADDRARRVALALVDEPGDPRTLADWGRTVGASERTLARLFARETGLRFDHWRTQLRVAASLPMLAAHVPVATVARSVGYATPSAFIAAFRRTVGTTPRRYFGVNREA